MSGPVPDSAASRESPAPELEDDAQGGILQPLQPGLVSLAFVNEPQLIKSGPVKVAHAGQQCQASLFNADGVSARTHAASFRFRSNCAPSGAPLSVARVLEPRNRPGCCEIRRLRSKLCPRLVRARPEPFLIAGLSMAQLTIFGGKQAAPSACRWWLLRPGLPRMLAGGEPERPR